MDTIESQFVSAVLHVAFLILCFMVPAHAAVERLEPDMAFERWVEARIVVTAPPKTREVSFAVEHVDGFFVGGGQGTVADNGAGPEWGGAVGATAKAPRKGPHERSSGEVISERTRVDSGNALEGVAGEDAATSDEVVGPLADGADGGGGTGHAERDEPEPGSGSGGVGFGACGCADPSNMGRGSSAGRGLPMLGKPRVLPEPQLERTPSSPDFIVPTISAAKPVVSCAPCAAIIERVIQAHMREIRYCYERALERNSRLEGELMLTLRIPKQGGVPIETSASLPMPADQLESCAQDRMSRWIFPELPHDAKANFPVRLSRM